MHLEFSILSYLSNWINLLSLGFLQLNSCFAFHPVAVNDFTHNFIFDVKLFASHYHEVVNELIYVDEPIVVVIALLEQVFNDPLASVSISQATFFKVPMEFLPRKPVVSLAIN